MNRFFEEPLPGGMKLCCMVEPLGADYHLSVYGGERPHVGSLILAQARPSLTGVGIGATSSVLNALGHKDEQIGRRFAETLAKEKNCTVSCACGIHVDHITNEQLTQIKVAAERLLHRVTESLSDPDNITIPNEHQPNI